MRNKNLSFYQGIFTRLLNLTALGLAVDLLPMSFQSLKLSVSLPGGRDEVLGVVE